MFVGAHAESEVAGTIEALVQLEVPCPKCFKVEPRAVGLLEPKIVVVMEDARFCDYASAISTAATLLILCWMPH